MNANEYTIRLEKIEDALQQNLLESQSNNEKTFSLGVLPKGVSLKHREELTKPCQNLMELGGKRWRPLLLVLCAEMINSNEKTQEKAIGLTPLVEFVHTASLIHDDIEDAADTRRGKPATHIVYGVDTAINAATWLYFQAFLPIAQTEIDIREELYFLLSQEIRRLHLGQAMDISWHKNNRTIPSIEEYEAMIRLKTGTLASLAAQIGILVGGGSLEDARIVGEIAADIGVSFQILDDYINLTTGNKGKKRGDDIVEGKKSLPILLHLEKHPEDISFFMEKFNQARKEGINSSAIEEAIQRLTVDDALVRAKKISEEKMNNACNKLCELYPNNDKAKLICQLFLDLQK